MFTNIGRKITYGQYSSEIVDPAGMTVAFTVPTRSPSKALVDGFQLARALTRGKVERLMQTGIC